MKTLVIPTIREKNINEFFAAWRSKGGWEKIIVVEDNPEITFCLPAADCHVSWKEIDADLGDDAWIISRRDSAIRSYGFLLAHRMEADFIFTLDDDCFPLTSNFCETHMSKLTSTPKWTESILGMRTRGIPYFNKGTLNNVVLNMGQWAGIPDLDAPQTLHNPQLNFQPPQTDRIIPVGQYFPMCGMNLSFKREIAPLMYFPLMGQNSPYRRFDDIWCGIIAKRICDHLGLYVHSGEPYIDHLRASDPMTNLVKEAPGIKYNEEFWEVIEDVKLVGSTPIACMLEMGRSLASNNNDYVAKLGKAIIIWTHLFEE